jgi:BirA family transcriptional regulator, biotin operon repressor / biotin---[acetyl-CoA-carboxylase] ligase
LSNTIFIGKVYKCFDDLPSTNDYALNLLDFRGENAVTTANPMPLLSDGSVPTERAAKSRPADGMVIRAVNQSAGHGQFGSRWKSADGENLTCSVILYPGWLPAARQFDLSMAVALSAEDVVRALRDQAGASAQSVPITLKWPNDLYLGSRKCGGILIQNGLLGDRIQWSVVGLGLNINQMQFDREAPNAVSLAMAFGQTFDIEVVLQHWCIRLEQRYLQLKSGGSAALRALYESHLYRRRQRTTFRVAATSQLFEGEITGVSETGRLQILTAEGVSTFGVKEVAME